MGLLNSKMQVVMLILTACKDQEAAMLVQRELPELHGLADHGDVTPDEEGGGEGGEVHDQV